MRIRNLPHFRFQFSTNELSPLFVTGIDAARFRQEQTGITNHGLLAGSSLSSKLPIATGSCAPAPPTRVYERSKPLGPSTFISQLSFARDPTIDTRHSPGLSLSTCSMTATISPRARGSPVFCISILTAMSPILYKAGEGNTSRAELGQRLMAARCVKSPIDSRDGLNRTTTSRVSGLSKNESGDCRSGGRSPLEMVFHNCC